MTSTHRRCKKGVIYQESWAMCMAELYLGKPRSRQAKAKECALTCSSAEGGRTKLPSGL